jgi:hypothetical protein
MSRDTEPTEFELLADVQRSLPREPRGTKLESPRAWRWPIVALTVVVVVAGVLVFALTRGAGDQTSAAATCLKNAIANGSASNNCADSTGVQALQSNSTHMNVSCTHQAANQYICDVTSSGPVPEPTGFYGVTYDGSSIVYQKSG